MVPERLCMPSLSVADLAGIVLKRRSLLKDEVTWDQTLRTQHFAVPCGMAAIEVESSLLGMQADDRVRGDKANVVHQARVSSQEEGTRCILKRLEEQPQSACA